MPNWSYHKINLVYLLVGIYFLIFLGIPISSDEITLADSIESFANRGNMLRNAEYGISPRLQADGTPALNGKYEPLQVMVGAGIYWLARHIPFIGNFHMVMLLNIFITTLQAWLILWGGKQLGFSHSTAWLTAFLFGVATLAFPYTRWLFREPLTGLLLTLVFFSAFRLRQNNYKLSYDWGLLFIGILGSLLAKQISLFILPGIFLVLLPKQLIHKRSLMLLLASLGLMLVTIGILSALNLQEGRYQWNEIQQDLVNNIELNWVLESVVAYQVSASRSIWLFSPILIWGLWGFVWYIRHNEWRIAFAPIVAILLLSASYGVSRRLIWWGGWGWGPRYLLPLMPLMTIWLLPVIEELKQPQHKVLRVLFGFTALISIGIQLIGIGVSYTNYYTEIENDPVWGYADTANWAHWANFNWEWEVSLIPYHWKHFDVSYLVQAWGETAYTAPLILIILGFIGLVIIAQGRKASILQFGAMIIVLSIGLYALQDDVRYTEYDENMLTLMHEVDANTTENDAIFFTEAYYIPASLNYTKHQQYILSLKESNFKTELRNPTDRSVHTTSVAWLLENFDSAWYITNKSGYATAETRLIEQYLVSQYYLVQTIEAENYRAIQFMQTDQLIQETVDVNLGNLFQLNSYAINTNHLAQGEVLTIDLEWQTLTQPTQNYNISVQLATAENWIITQLDTSTNNTFLATSDWVPGEAYHLRYGLYIPDTTIPADYNLQVVIYDWQTQRRLTTSNNANYAVLVPIQVNGR